MQEIFLIYLHKLKTPPFQNNVLCVMLTIQVTKCARYFFLYVLMCADEMTVYLALFIFNLLKIIVIVYQDRSFKLKGKA